MIRSFEGVKLIWKKRKYLGESSNQAYLAEFYPAALEVQETPPNPLARWVSRCLILLFSLTLLWACFSDVDVVASAEGKIIPSTRVKQIQPLEKAVVSRILVSEGQFVSQGQSLVELDATQTQADQSRLTGEMINAEYELAMQLKFIDLLNLDSLAQDNVTATDLQVVNGRSDAVKALLYSQMLAQKWQAYRAEIASNQNAAEGVLSQQRFTMAMIQKLESTLPIIEKRAKDLKALYTKQFTTEQDYLEAEQERIQVTQDLIAERERLQQMEANYREAKEKTKFYIARTKQENMARIAELQNMLSSVAEELNKATSRNNRYVLYAPVSGFVQQLQISTVGGVVTDAQQLMLIVPEDDELEAEVFLKNQDIGFVTKGMPAEIKVHTFPFTKYGVIDGVIESVYDDAVIDEKQGLLFGMRVKLKQSSLVVQGKEVKLKAGMGVTSEVKTDKRRVIEYILSPMIRHKKESLRER